MRKYTRWILVGSGLLVLFLAGCSGTPPAPTPTPVAAATTAPTPEPVSAQPTSASTAVAQDALERVKSAGVLRIATSADYPPFETYDENFKLTGFDIALIQAIGEKLGLQVEVNDYAFDGLFSTLQLDQADAAIGAISLTPERSQRVDFSDFYLIGHGAVLGSDKKELPPIRTPDDLSKLRIGVQGGTVYESWAKSLYRDWAQAAAQKNSMPEASLQIYPDADQAAKDVKAGLIDVALMDLRPAKAFAQQGGVKVLAQDLNDQRFAIALPKGQPALRRAINKALAELQSDNTITDLREKYLGEKPGDIALVTPEPQSPTPTAEPTAAPSAPPTAAAPAACIDGMAWVGDLSFDDKNMTAPPVVAPGQPFVKSWRVRNTGTCTWDGSYLLGYDHGNVPAAAMNGQPVRVQGSVAPGATYDFSANLVAPTIPGVYRGVWQMRNGAGQGFGETIFVGIRVPTPAQPTAAPTQTPVPGITFTASNTNIKQGECVTLSWNVANVKAVYYYQQGQNWQDHGVGGQDSRQECPQQTTTYELRVVMPDNSVQTRQIRVDVTQVAKAPQIASFTVNPQGQVQPGQCVTLQWNVTGTINTVSLRRNNQTVWDGAPYQGSYQDCPPGTGNMAYLLKAGGPGGSSQAAQTVTVVQAPPTQAPPTQAPPPTAVPPTQAPPPEPPAIDSFTVDPAQVSLGQCVNIMWSFHGTDLATAQLLRNSNVITSDLAPSGSQQDCSPAAGSVEYRIQVASEFAGSATRSQMVTVADAQPGPTPKKSK